MKKTKSLIAVLIGLLALASCSSDNNEIDTEYPVIDISASNAFPIQCSEITRGQKITFRAKFTDNAALGSYSLDIHHNFDHHTHSTEVNNCVADPIKKPVNPMLYINSVTIPNGEKSYEAVQEITIPTDIDPGDYHFMIRLTDKEGWQTIKGLSIKIL
ncbi:hypothetical protein FLA105534_03099 [Flavobacterium bizetiae]|uniref:DUF4625 domain-containing protein n=1 Tax=Flavobacterium bizetiae TaxID=2704140 RepID=A0A6J4GML0_9FLAO|nr:DUF4625 domain-containing protein [Flavobacterium bizetiae]CAA9200452.1 hypothetical protein FLA105534_03099 [Flavobacterium bizetiae]CAD5340598.1 hypothetical protein FLA105535_00553 [Flavobacterium bizetiae]CAD5346730.1 hypothetical protein FLA105534_00673 [Flavobacterium bizetiae]